MDDRIIELLEELNETAHLIEHRLTGIEGVMHRMNEIPDDPGWRLRRIEKLLETIAAALVAGSQE